MIRSDSNPSRSSRNNSEGQEVDTGNLWELNYKQAYVVVQRKMFTASGCHGPLDIFSPKLRCLLVLYAATSKCWLLWSLAEMHDTFASIRCAKLLFKLRPGQRSTARKWIDPWLASNGFALTQRFFIKLPHMSLVRYGQQYLSHAVWIHSTGPRLVKQWSLSRFRFCVGRPKRFNDFWNQSQICKYECGSCSTLPRCLPGNVYQCAKNWCIENRSGNEDELKQCEALVRQTMSRASIPVKQCGAISCQANKERIPSGLIHRWQQQRDTAASYETYTADFCFPDGSAVIPDDKFKKFAWIMPATTYLMLLSFFALSATTWHPTNLHMDEVNHWLHTLLVRILGESLRQKLGIETTIWLLPYVYVTMKDKCWFRGVRICPDPSHSCVRKVVSYATWVKKNTWRSIHRGWETIMKHHGDTCDTWSLDDASNQLKQKLWQLPVNRSGLCDCCRSPMKRCEGFVADAGQFYEVVSTGTAIKEAYELISIFTETSPDAHVTICNAPKRIGWFGGRRFTHTARGVTWSAEELLRAFIAAMSVTVASVGLKVFRMDGIPIGGLMSKVAACLTLGGQERRWKHSHAKQRDADYRARVAWSKAVCHLRYIDDIIMISHLYCRNCLILSLAEIYTVPFKVDPEEHILPWIDISINLAEYSVGLNIKHFHPPPHWAAPSGYLRSVILGRFRRWRVIDPPEREWKRACSRLLYDLSFARWSSKAVNSALFAISNIDFLPYVEFAIKAWKHIAVERACGVIPGSGQQ